jgi:hypothetical protein
VSNFKLILGLFCCLALSTIATLDAANVERVEYRLTGWKSVHFKDAAQAASYMKTFKSLHVECKQATHGDHIDVSFRCPKWQTLTLKSHSEAHNFQGFLSKIGFETKHAH